MELVPFEVAKQRKSKQSNNQTFKYGEEKL